jgi:hypothetical protein
MPGSMHQPEHAHRHTEPKSVHVSTRHVFSVKLDSTCRLMLADAHHLVLVIAVPFAIEFLRSVQPSSKLRLLQDLRTSMCPRGYCTRA